jgi:hypothetical protein
MQRESYSAEHGGLSHLRDNAGECPSESETGRNAEGRCTTKTYRATDLVAAACASGGTRRALSWCRRSALLLITALQRFR